jgi:hypothetical protein
VKIRLLGNLEKEVNDKFALEKAKIVSRAVNRLRNNTPVDTGYARDQWKLDLSGNISNDTEYLSDLNMGSSKQAPAFFIEAAMLTDPNLIPNGMIVTYK